MHGDIEPEQPDRTSGELATLTAGAGALSNRLETPELLFIALFIPIAVFSWVGITLAELGAFSGPLVFAAGTIASLLGLLVAGRDYMSAGIVRASVPSRTWWFLLFLVTLSAALFSRPGEYVIEGADASVYLGTGQHIAQSGQIVSVDPAVALVPREQWPAFFTPDRVAEGIGNRLPGALRIANENKAVPSFFHLLPVWIAIATTAAGSHGGYYVNVVIAILSVLTVWLVGRRVWSCAAGPVAALLLALNFGQIYYARIATSEMLAQFLLLAAMLFTVLTWDLRLRTAALCAGAAVGLAAFTRIDALLLMIPLAFAWWLAARRQQPGSRAWLWFAGTLAVMAAHAILHAVTVAALYTDRLFADGGRVLSRQPAITALLGGIAAAVTSAVIVLVRHRRWRFWIGLTVVLFLAVVPQPIIATTARLISPLGLTVAAAGALTLLARPLDWRVLPVVVPVVAQLLLLLAWRETTTLPADFRRAVPLLLPGAMLLIGSVVTEAGPGHRWRRRALWLVPVILGGTYLMDAESIVRRPLAQGLHQQIADLAAQVPEDAIVFTDRSLPGHLALALQLTFQRSALRLNARPAGAPAPALVVDRALTTGRPVYVAVSSLEDALPDRFHRSDFAGFDVREAASRRLAFEVAQPVRGSFQDQRLAVDVNVALYRITRRETAPPAARPLTLDIGEHDVPFVVEGFHATEAFGATRARWTTGEAKVAIPRLSTDTGANHAIVLRLSAYRPVGAHPAVVTIAVDDLLVGTIPNPGPDLRDYRLPLPASVQARIGAAPTMLTISVSPFVPKVFGLGTDERALGVVLDWIRIE